ncbi:MAG TPA: ABC transporter permease [Bryobacteraceae bacterium]|jgi:predicted permease|nr:ABC transporter permease [Bryobacteraceae bacterium]
MRWLTRILATLRALFLRDRAERDLDSELAYHLEQEIESNIRGGMTPVQARLAAQRLVGPVSVYKEECRDARGIGFVEITIRDVRFATRTLGRSPFFVAAAVLTLALGIGANTTVFTFVENILLRSVTAANPHQLMMVNWGDGNNLSYLNYLDFRDRNTSFYSVFAYRFMPINLSARARDNRRVWGYEATGNYFGTLGVKPLLGRFFGPADDDKWGAHPVLVLSYRLWRERFAGDPNIIGRNVKVNGYPFTVIGVAMPNFTGTELIVAADYWVPMCMVPQVEAGSEWPRYRQAQNAWVMGRLKPGITRAKAEADLNVILQQIARSYPNDVSNKKVISLSRPGLVGQSLRTPITSFGVVLMAVAATGLLLACVNLAGMLMARGSGRQHEIGIRIAVGASKIQLIRQLLTESLLLGMAGGVLGMAFTYGACRLINAWHFEFDIPFAAALAPDQLVLGFTAAITLVTTLLFGLLPALQSVRADVVPSLKNEPLFNRSRRWTMRDLVVAGQVALSMTLVLCSVLMIRSLQHALTLNLGFQPAGAYSVAFDLSMQGYSVERSQRFDTDLLAKVSTIPGIESSGIINNLPLNLAGANSDFIGRADRPVPKPADRRVAMSYSISPGYLKAAGTKLLEGRDIDVHDRKMAPAVALANEALTHLLFGNENPLGQHVRMSTDPADHGVEIVGVVETGKYEQLGEEPTPAIFLPLAQTSGATWTTLVIRTALREAEATALLRKSALDMDPELTLFNLGSLKEHLALPLFPAQIAAIVLGIFGGLAMVLAATGLFASLAYSVAKRRREIGIRMALGARPSQILTAVLRKTFVLCGAGVCVGTAATLAAGHVLSSVLYGVSPHDSVTYTVAIVIFMAVALIACWHPASRATGIDPAQALRDE